MRFWTFHIPKISQLTTEISWDSQNKPADLFVVKIILAKKECTNLLPKEDIREKVTKTSKVKLCQLTALFTLVYWLCVPNRCVIIAISILIAEFMPSLTAFFVIFVFRCFALGYLCNFFQKMLLDDNYINYICACNNILPFLFALFY